MMKGKAARGLELVSCPTARTRQLADLPEQLIMEILLRFPARTLVSFKSVCTSWRNLISSPDFARNHHRRSCLRDPSLTPPRIACYTYPGSDAFMESFSVQSMLDNPSEPTKVDYFRGQCYYRMVDSYNGLLCFFDYDGSHMKHVILWNPCTGFTFESPEISGERAYFSGFGYDHLSDSYKFCAIVGKTVTSGLEYSTRIYTFEPTSSWRRIDDNPFDPLGLPAYDVVMADDREGKFFLSSRVCTINWSIYHVVLYLDLEKETYGHFSLPDMDLDDYLWRQYTHTHLCVLRNCLSVCYEQHGRWIVWQMKEYGDAQSWTKLTVIPLDPKFNYSSLYRCLKPFYLSESDVFLAFSSSYRIVLRNLNDGSIDFPVFDRSFSQSIGHRMAYIYHESLVSPHGLQSNSSERLLRFIQPKPKPIDS